MGVSITCKKTNRSIDMSYFGFATLRRKIAALANTRFGQHYEKQYTVPYLVPELAVRDADAIKKMFIEYNEETDRIIKEKLVSTKIIDFCFQSYCDGRIRYGACKELLRVIGDYDDNICYWYIGRKDCAKFADFKVILQDCVNTKSDLVWY